MGRGGLRQIVKASLFGVPLPLCSCGVLPVASALRAHGASRGATLSFLTSTPQTGVDSIMITHGLLGPLFALVRVVVAFVSGVLCGVLTETFTAHEARDEVQPEEAAAATPENGHSMYARVKQGLRHGFVTIARSIARATLLGVLIAGALTTFIPEELFAVVSQNEWVSMCAMLVVGIPLYVCSSGSVPLAYAFMSLGVSPGAALVFLIVGPATNMATVTTVWQQLGRRSVMIYLISLTACAIAAGVCFDAVLSAEVVGQQMASAHHTHLTRFEHVSAIVLLLIFAPKLIPRRKVASSG